MLESPTERAGSGGGGEGIPCGEGHRSDQRKRRQESWHGKSGGLLVFFRRFALHVSRTWGVFVRSDRIGSIRFGRAQVARARAQTKHVKVPVQPSPVKLSRAEPTRPEPMIKSRADDSQSQYGMDGMDGCMEYPACPLLKPTKAAPVSPRFTPPKVANKNRNRDFFLSLKNDSRVQQDFHES
jgi:hypothetical protein